MIPLARPALDAEAEAEVVKVLRSGMLVQGQRVLAFEQTLAAFTGHDHAVVVASGTAALYLALEVLGVGMQSTVLCPALTWPSPAHAARLLGAQVRFVDVDSATWNATPDAYREALVGNPEPPSTLAIAIDQFGSPADVQGIEDAVECALLLDAACSLGSEDDGQATRDRGVVACHSFHPRKVLTTGEGGACLTNDAALAEELRMRRNHGQRRSGVFEIPAHNFRQTDLGAAIGLAQLNRLPELLAAREVIAKRYQAELPATLPQQQIRPRCRWNAQTFGILVPPGTRARWIQALRERGVEAGVLSYALSQVDSLSEDRLRSSNGCPNAENIAARGMALPMYAAMQPSEVEQVVAAVHDCEKVLA